MNFKTERAMHFYIYSRWLYCLINESICVQFVWQMSLISFRPRLVSGKYAHTHPHIQTFQRNQREQFQPIHLRKFILKQTNGAPSEDVSGDCSTGQSIITFILDFIILSLSNSIQLRYAWPHFHSTSIRTD